MQNAGLVEAKAGIKIARRNISNLRFADNTPCLCQKAKRNQRASWWMRRVKKLAWNSAFKKWRSWIWSYHFMANRWGNNGNSDGRYFLGLQSHCWRWLQPWNLKPLLLGRKAMTNLDSVLKSRDITLLTRICLVKAMVFPVVMYGCESWTIKKSWCWRIDALELWC